MGPALQVIYLRSVAKKEYPLEWKNVKGPPTTKLRSLRAAILRRRAASSVGSSPGGA